METIHTYSVDITVYADTQMQTVIHKDTIYESLEEIELITQIEDDLLDGDDWWQDIVDEVENKLGANWNCIEVVSFNRHFGRILERDYCVLGLEPKNDFVWMNKLFLFGENRWDNIGETFSGSIIFSDQLSNIQSDQYYRYGSDANVIVMIKEIASRELFSCNVVDVVINPSASSILSMGLIGHYKLMISIPTKIKVDRLKQIYQSMNICTEIFDELSYQRRLVRINKIPELDFLDKAFDQVQIMLDAQSENSLFSTLKNEFKPKFDI